MSPLKRRLVEDRAMRDAARAVVRADIELLKASLGEEGAAARSMEAGGDYLRLVGEGAWDVIADNRGKSAGLFGLALAGLAAWFFREEVTEAVTGFLEALGEPAEDDDAGESSPPTEEPLAEHRP